MTSSLICFQADLDVSGIGVRAAIYIQNLLSFIPAIWALWDKKVSMAELDAVEKQSTTILITAFAILISTIVETRTANLSNFHASIVLSLSWMNNTNTFIYFLLYVQHKSLADTGRIEGLSSWIKHIRDKIWANLGLRNEDPEDPEQLRRGIEAKPPLLATGDPGAKPPRPKSLIQRVFGRIVLVLGSLHLSLMAGLGIWLWSNPGSFGTGSTCGINNIFMTILGQSVPLGSPRLRTWSIAIYSLFLVPGFNLVLPMSLFLGLFLGYQAYSHRKTASIVPTVTGLAVLFAINIIFLVDIELTLLQASGDSVWTFGQILAMLLLVLPLRDLLETFFSRHEKQRIKDLTGFLENAIRDEAPQGRILEFVKKGADVNLVLEGCDYATVLQLASHRANVKLVKLLLDHGADTNVQGGKHGTALQAALFEGHLYIAALLLDNGADPNVRGGKYGTALQAASYEGYLETVRLLLAKGADPNVQDGKYGTALQAALFEGHLNIVTLLLHKGADPNVRGGKYGTALQAASYQGHLEIVTLLLEKGADPNAQGGEYGTALQAASYRQNLEVVVLLLNKGADPNVQGGEYGTALQAASYGQNLEIVVLLLDKGADPNTRGGVYGTALQAASASYGQNLKIVMLLLDKGADPNAQGGVYGTALQAASASYRQNLEIVALLLDKGADPNAQGASSVIPRTHNQQVHAGSVYGPALQAASFQGHLDVVKLLLEKGADPNIQAGKYGTALQAVAYQGHLEIVTLLLDKGANPNVQGGEYGTALQAVSYQGHLEIVMLLLDKGADPNVQGGEYGTALQAASASYRPNPDIVTLLLDKGADPNVQGGVYGTALQAASFEGHQEIATMLLEKGADPNVQGSKSETTLQAASFEGHWHDSWAHNSHNKSILLF